MLDVFYHDIDQLAELIEDIAVVTVVVHEGCLLHEGMHSTSPNTESVFPALTTSMSSPGLRLMRSVALLDAA